MTNDQRHEIYAKQRGIVPQETNFKSMMVSELVAFGDDHGIFMPTKRTKKEDLVHKMHNLFPYDPNQRGITPRQRRRLNKKARVAAG